MNRLLRCWAVLLLLATADAWALAHQRARMVNTKLMTAASEDVGELKEYKGEASNLFGNLRIPSALFAGASAGAAFALPLANGEGLKVGLVKRLYALLMMGALSSEVVAVLISTLAVSAISTNCPPTRSLDELLKEHYAVQWVAARLHFFSGIFMFIVGVGIRAWITIGCPIIAKAALGIVLSSAMLCLAFIQQTEGSNLLDGIAKLPFQYIQLMLKESKQKPLFAAAMAMGFATTVYMGSNVPHIIQWLNK